MNRRRMWLIARTDLTQLAQARDYWIPMAVLGLIFFVFIPLVVLISVTHLSSSAAVEQISKSLSMLPDSARHQIERQTPAGRTTYALSVFLFAPIAVVVPLTISTAVGAVTIVGERERGTGEFLAHSPATLHEIYLGKLLASFIPGYLTAVIGFGCYSLVVNLVAGPAVGHWFFPTSQWLVMVFWVVPPFLMFTLSLVVRLSARVKSTAAAQQASGLVSLPLILVAYAQSSGALFSGIAAGFLVGAAAWMIALASLARGTRSLTRDRLLGVGDKL